MGENVRNVWFLKIPISTILAQRKLAAEFVPNGEGCNPLFCWRECVGVEPTDEVISPVHWI